MLGEHGTLEQDSIHCLHLNDPKGKGTNKCWARNLFGHLSSHDPFLFRPGGKWTPVKPISVRPFLGVITYNPYPERQESDFFRQLYP